MMRFGGAYEHMIVLDADSLMEDRDHRPARCQGHAKRKRQVIMVIHNAHHVVNADSHHDGPTPAKLPDQLYQAATRGLSSASLKGFNDARELGHISCCP
jgi:hypothetical protein